MDAKSGVTKHIFCVIAFISLHGKRDFVEKIMTDHIKDKSIIVTGAASGFGRLVSQKAAAMGAKITCADVNAEGLEDVVSELNDQGLAAQGVVTDVRDAGQVQALADAAIAEFGAIDVMYASLVWCTNWSNRRYCKRLWYSATAWYRCIIMAMSKKSAA